MVGLILLSVSVPAEAVQPAPQPPPRMRILRTAFYELHTDVSEIEAREAAVRMDVMAARFLDDTEHLNRRPPPYMPFELYRRVGDYEAAGGTPGSGGQYSRTTGKLMAVAGAELDEKTWHRVQHESFHQFAHHTLGAEIPPWVNEGLAEYYGEAAFTGDWMVLGLVPPERQQRVVAAIREGTFVPIERLMLMTEDQWNAALDRQHYDQAWSLVVFLLHGDGGRYAAQWGQFLELCSQGRGWLQAWKATFGNIDGLERAWARWWERLPQDATAVRYREATARTLTSFWSRALAQGQNISSFEELIRLGKEGKLAFDDRQWLPPSLLKEAIADAERLRGEGGSWMIRRVEPSMGGPVQPGASAVPRAVREGYPELVLLMPDGTAYRGRFATEGRRVSGVEVSVEELPADLLAEFERLLGR